MIKLHSGIEQAIGIPEVGAAWSISSNLVRIQLHTDSDDFTGYLNRPVRFGGDMVGRISDIQISAVTVLEITFDPELFEQPTVDQLQTNNISVYGSYEKELGDVTVNIEDSKKALTTSLGKLVNIYTVKVINLNTRRIRVDEEFLENLFSEGVFLSDSCDDNGYMTGVSCKNTEISFISESGRYTLEFDVDTNIF